MKRVLSILLVLALVCSLLPAAMAEDIPIVDAEAENDGDGLIALIDAPNTAASGACGDNLTWTYEDGTLTIAGEGAMTDDFGVELPGWIEYSKEIERVVIDEGVTSVGLAAFEDDKVGSEYPKLKTVVLADSVKTIGKQAFRYQKALSSVTFGKGLKTIGSRAFEGCDAIGAVFFPDGLKKIGFMSFFNSGLSSLVIPDSVTLIDASAFAQCDSLSRAVIGAGVKEINASAFFNCEKLSTVWFMGGAPTISYGGFGDVTATVWYPDNGSWPEALRKDYEGTLTWKPFETSGDCGDDMSWALSGSKLVISGVGDMWNFNSQTPGWNDVKFAIQKLKLDYGVERIGNCAFQSCQNLCGVEMPPPPSGDDEEWNFYIGDYAFNGCLSLGAETILLPSNTYKIGDYAFGFSTVRHIELNKGLKQIGDGAFQLTALEELTIPASVMEIGALAFAWNYALTDITFLCRPASLSEDCCTGVTATAWYPAFDPQWKQSFLKDYGGTLTWQPLPSAPKLTLVGMDTDGIHLSWTAVPDATGYRIRIFSEMFEHDDTDQYGVAWDHTTAAEYLFDGSNLGELDYFVMGGKYWFDVQPDAELTDYSNRLILVYNPFSDVSGTKTIEYVAWAFNNGIVKGTSKTSFSPDAPCTRINFIMMLWKMHGSPEVSGVKNPFSDISGTKTTKAICWALKEGVINSGRKFYPDEPISRVQIVMILWKMAGSPAVSGKCPFTDVSGTKTTQAVLWAYKKGITKGTSATTFAPDKDCTRVQLVVFLYKYNGIYEVI